MAYPVWVSTAGNLGVVPEDQYIKIQLSAYDPGGNALKYSFIAGEFPPGTYISSVGVIEGVPIVTTAVAAEQSVAYQFTIRATNIHNEISDRTFSITVSNIVPPQITPRTTYLGDYFDGSFFSLQLKALEVNPNATLTWELESGSLPTGVTLNSNGLISGFIYPLPAQGNAGLTGYGAAPYDQYGYDNAPSYVSSYYQFTVRVFDGINYDSLSYTLRVADKSAYTADDGVDPDNDTYLTVDADNLYNPIVTTPSQTLPPARINTNYAFQFSAIDPNQQPILFSVNGASATNFDMANFDITNFDASVLGLPAGINLDLVTGWMYGNVGFQAAASQTYTFQVTAYKRDYPTYISKPITYKWTILGDFKNTINWITASDVGTINNGAISELLVAAVNNDGKSLTYSLVSPSGLPQGLTLLPSGLISGRASFEYFSIDSGAVTIDGRTTTFDDTYTFTVNAVTGDGTSSSTKTFTIRVNNDNLIPYENLYLKALPSLDQRQTFLSVVNNSEIFPSNLIYRAGDPWFGTATEMRSLFLAGIAPHQLTDYLSAMNTNHYSKRIEFSNVKTAQALDENFNVKYEVVYIDLNDDEETADGQSPANSKRLTNQNFYNTNPAFNTAYPNSFQNMQSVIETPLTYANQGALPAWMTSPQPDKTVLGFTRAIVLAYTVPGASKLIAYRLFANNIAFNSIDFVADRYSWDNVLSSNYDTSLNKFISGTETTFDRIFRPQPVTVSVHYAIRGMSFQDINGQTVGYVQGLGGFDGVFNIVDGQTLVFAQQENYPTYQTGAHPNDGWNIINGASNTIIPGYQDNLFNPSVVNQRGGIWRINLSTPPNVTLPSQTSTFGSDLVGFDTRPFDDTIVWPNPPAQATQVITLTFVQPLPAYQSVQVNLGKSNGSTLMFYDLALKPGKTVPEFSRLTVQSRSAQNDTQFDGTFTKFINNRDPYTVPGTSDTYLKFPRTNVFQ